ncbi:AT-rich interactive domain-containing protein 1A-like isoform X2 [Engraulis encrasicolus]|uniref:AT-rich interactive domain-containing protein 1A-like isoform X2 n=1 Tax=Engraulis encrasicolus TaxID=184585 RepID=UPI002FCE9AE0
MYDDQKPQAASKSVQQTQPSLTTQATASPKQQTKQQDGGSIPQHAKSKMPVAQMYDDQKPQAASKSVQQTQPSLTTQATDPPKQQTKQQDGGSIPQHAKSKMPVAQMYDDQKPQATSKSVQQTQPSLTTQATDPPKQQTKQQDGGSIPQHAKSKMPVAQMYDDQKPQAASKSVQQTQQSLTTQSTAPPKQQTKQHPLTAGHKSKRQQKRQLYSLS